MQQLTSILDFGINVRAIGKVELIKKGLATLYIKRGAE